jgi:hypothetical protein
MHAKDPVWLNTPFQQAPNCSRRPRHLRSHLREHSGEGDFWACWRPQGVHGGPKPRHRGLAQHSSVMTWAPPSPPAGPARSPRQSPWRRPRRRRTAARGAGCWTSVPVPRSAPRATPRGTEGILGLGPNPESSAPRIHRVQGSARIEGARRRSRLGGAGAFGPRPSSRVKRPQGATRPLEAIVRALLGCVAPVPRAGCGS